MKMTNNDATRFDSDLGTLTAVADGMLGRVEPAVHEICRRLTATFRTRFEKKFGHPVRFYQETQLTREMEDGRKYGWWLRIVIRAEVGLADDGHSSGHYTVYTIQNFVRDASTVDWMVSTLDCDIMTLCENHEILRSLQQKHIA